jgi:hypothetical protein
LVDAGRSVDEIADQFKVSRDLVLFRAKVTRCYRALVSPRWRRPASVGGGSERG